MTIVIAAKHDGKTVIGADTCTTVGHKKLTNMVNGSKLVRFDNFIVGMSGTGPIREVLDRMLVDEACEQDEETGETTSVQRWKEHRMENTIEVANFLERFFELYQERGEADEMHSVELLFITADKIFCTMGEAVIFEVSDFWAVGSGADFAVGALDIMYPTLEGSPDLLPVMVEDALNVACKYADGCLPPVEIMSL